MSKKFLKAFVVATAFAAGVSGLNHINPTPVAEASQTQAYSNYKYSAEVTKYLNELNAIRKASGAPELTIDPRFSESAQNHAVYIAKHGATHTQDKSKSGFTGESPKDRFVAVGGNPSNYGGFSEALAHSTEGLSTAFASLLESIGHRGILLAGYRDTVGIGIIENNIVFVTSDNKGTENKDYTSVKYPYNGQIGVDTAYDLVNVSSSPLTKYGASKAGYVVSFAPYSSKYDTPFNIELYDSKNTRVETLNPKNQADGHDAFFYVIPKAELKKGEKYTAKATWVDDDGAPQSETWSFATTKTTTESNTLYIPTKEEVDSWFKPNPTPPAPSDITGFSDYQADQYWAEDFQWAVNNGIISGYQNVKNPKTGKYENLLKPYTNLTENQMLSVLLRYFKPTELSSTKAKTSWYGDVNYQLATKYGLPVLGANTASKQALAGKDISRGNFARILASMHYGKTVSQSEAIKFLRDNDLTTTKTDAEFKPNTSLARAHAVAFFHRYEQTFNK